LEVVAIVDRNLGSRRNRAPRFYWVGDTNEPDSFVGAIFGGSLIT